MERILVAVEATDPVLHSGVTALVRYRPEIEVVPATEMARAAVLLVCVDTVDTQVLTLVRRHCRSLNARVVLLVSALRDGDLLGVVECGTAAVIWRHEASSERIVEAVALVARGFGQLPPDLTGSLLGQVGQIRRQNGRDSPGVAGLANREIDILRLIAEGLDTREIAVKLAYSERTVKNALHGLMTRMHLRNRAHAVAYAVREGYLR
ncbi:response regulator transcription factor [Frankia sp. AgKG'84/4]|uniref:response regulator transcription factor n=1 Tax=Frankia sp. AgKG'84/4 TaxID=573490 RepID=UPI00200FF147|nr:response regulator transcription factor [Frankia sp. AgKG'84/4]MCL9793970.1 response regulator transcription factor [Frankia sp. AgKG'84/4]